MLYQAGYSVERSELITDSITYINGTVHAPRRAMLFTVSCCIINAMCVAVDGKRWSRSLLLRSRFTVSRSLKSRIRFTSISNLQSLDKFRATLLQNRENSKTQWTIAGRRASSRYLRKNQSSQMLLIRLWCLRFGENSSGGRQWNYIERVRCLPIGVHAYDKHKALSGCTTVRVLLTLTNILT